VLIFTLGDFACGFTRAVLMAGLGILVAAVGLALQFGRVRGS